MPDLTFIIPIGPAHQHLAQRALDSVAAQTVTCDVAALVDTDGVGPGVLRNRMLRDVQTPFSVFLDADDWVEPTFAAETLAEYQRIGGNRYIFTDWYDNRGVVVQTPCLNGPDGYPLAVPDRQPYCNGTWHVLTTLLPTAWVREVGGFDEDMPGSEDTDFYLRLCTTLRCGHHLAKPLFHYAPNGGRARAFQEHPERGRFMALLTQRYGGRMGCCGDNGGPIKPVGGRQANDVLAMAQWRGNRTEVGRVTQRMYPRISFPRTAWVDPRDVAQSPTLWRQIEQPPPAAPPPEPGLNLAGLAQAGLATVKRAAIPDYAPPKNEPPPPPVQAKPDASRVLRLANRKPSTDEPIFIFPAKDYPSYSDIKRLVQLAGFDSATKIDAFSRRPLIIVSPEGLPDLSGLKARIIAWQLEYAGDYTHNYDGFTGEVWASDKAWAEAHGARYVLMGSHAGLVVSRYIGRSLDVYDVTMLGYMTPRRQAIKAQLSDLRWPPDYPGHDTDERNALLSATRLMLHVHQHDHAPFLAPQRIALAAAYHMLVVSETTPGAGDLGEYLITAPYDQISETVQTALNLGASDLGDRLHRYLCEERPFRACVMEALQS